MYTNKICSTNQRLNYIENIIFVLLLTRFFEKK